MTTSGLVDVWPLTPMQEGLAFHTRYGQGGTDVYTVQLVLELAGPLQVQRLRLALQALLERHPNLKAAFVQVASGATVSVVARDVRPALAEVDLSSLAEAEALAEAARLAEEDHAAGFELARRLGVTLNTVVQAAWGVLLGRLAASSDVVFGAVVSGRPAEVPGVDSMVGLFIATVPVRVRLAPGESMSSLVVRLQAEQSTLGAHQHLGLAGIQQAVGLGELFDTAMVFENYPAPAGAGPGGEALAISPVAARDATHYPLTLAVAPGERMGLRLDYRADLFERDFVEATAARLVRILNAAAATPDVALGSIDILSADERTRLLV